MSLNTIETLLSTEESCEDNCIKSGWMVGYKRFGIRRQIQKNVVISTTLHPVVSEKQSLEIAIRYISKLDDLSRMKAIRLESYIRGQRTACIACGGKGHTIGSEVKTESRVTVEHITCTVCKGSGVISESETEKICHCKDPFVDGLNLNICPTCKGTGIYMEDWCLTCQGTGAVCSNCQGSGKIIEKIPERVCYLCTGSGYLLDEKIQVEEKVYPTNNRCDVCNGKGYLFTEVVEKSILERYPERETDSFMDFDGLEFMSLNQEINANTVFNHKNSIVFRFEDRLVGPIFSKTEETKLVQIDKLLSKINPQYGQIYERVDCYLLRYRVVLNAETNEMELLL